MHKTDSLVYIGRDISSVPILERSSNVIQKAEEQISYRFLKRFSKVTTAVNGCDYLIAEIVTPYGEELYDDEIEENLALRFPEKCFDYFKTVFVSTHDSNAGTHHRVLVIHQEDQKDPPLVFQDYSIPVELFSLGLAEKAVAEGHDNFISVLNFDSHLILTVYTGGMLSFFIREPYESLEHAGERIDRLIRFLKADSFHKVHGNWDVFVYQNQLHDVQLKDYSVVKQAEATLPELMIEGMKEISNSELAEKLNVLTSEKIEKRDIFRNVMTVVKELKITALAAVLIIGSLLVYKVSLDSEVASLEEKSETFTQQLNQLDSIQTDVEGLLTSVKQKRGQMLVSIPWRSVLNDLAARLPKGGMLNSLRIDTQNNKGTIRTSVVVRSWDDLAAFEKNISNTPLFSNAKLSSKNKRKNGEVVASLQLEVEWKK